jgi:hypothetical protein
MPSRRHDPYWDLDGEGARRVRARQRVVRYAMWFLLLVALAIVLTRLPSIDPTFLLTGEGRPVLAGALMALLGSAALLALARVRHVSRR